jgi:hypothetical protein
MFRPSTTANIKQGVGIRIGVQGRALSLDTVSLQLALSDYTNYYYENGD